MARSSESINSKPSKVPKPTAGLVESAQSLTLHPSDPKPRAVNGRTRSAQVPANKEPVTILSLANEILDLILDQIEEDPSRGVNVTRRAYLSQESFRSLPFPSTKASSTRVQDLSNWRITCRRFAEVGAIHQFARVTTRFSQEEFRKLEWLAGQEHLVRHVKKFSYMVPWFYVQGSLYRFSFISAWLTVYRTRSGWRCTA
jgi:hypothetical protein